MDAEEFVKICDDCQRTKTPRGRDDMPLRPMMGARAFAKWGIDFVGPIAPSAYKTHAQYIIVANDYLTKWIEAKATAKNDAKTIAQFLYENIFTRYGLPIEIALRIRLSALFFREDSLRVSHTSPTTFPCVLPLFPTRGLLQLDSFSRPRSAFSAAVES
ncbi:hypothetical protein L7F22_054935 [Adiantum nelumboides]|nr:hypothetical protein [Adiantum nelumboides]